MRAIGYAGDRAVGGAWRVTTGTLSMWWILIVEDEPWIVRGKHVANFSRQQRLRTMDFLYGTNNPLEVGAGAQTERNSVPVTGVSRLNGFDRGVALTLIRGSAYGGLPVRLPCSCCAAHRPS
jgi:hypothetical protein